MSRPSIIGSLLALAVVGSGVLGTTAAEAMVYPLKVFTSGGPSFSGNVTVVEDADVTFTFTNTTADSGSSITGIYFSAAFGTAFLDTLTLPSSTTTTFSPAGTEPLPDAPSFDTGSAFTSSIAGGVTSVDSPLTLTGTFSSGSSGPAFAAVQAAVAEGNIGVRVQNGSSSSSSTSATTVTNPLPAAAWLFMSALAGLFGWQRWLRRQGDADGVAA